MRSRITARTGLPIALVAGLAPASCSTTLRTLVDAPNLYRGSDARFVVEGPKETTVELLYATDRLQETDENGTRYTHRRSQVGAMGTCTVSFHAEAALDWATLAAASTAQVRSREIELEVGAVDELEEIPSPSFTKYTWADGQWSIRPEFVVYMEHETARVNRLLSTRLADVSRKELFIFVHGVNTTFEFANIMMAQLWHMMGRPGVPLVYSWPAARSSGLIGYNYDRESSEYTVLHFKSLLQVVARNPELERVHIVAHSRGTDVVLSALRELHIYFEARGERTQEHLKLGQVLLAAPDLDVQVADTRFQREGGYTVAEQITVYFSKEDKAIRVASWLFGDERLGGDVSDIIDRESRDAIHSVHAIEVTSETRGYGHNYFLDDPATLSDVILVLRDGRRPGRANGRPLTPVRDGVWKLNEDYPR